MINAKIELLNGEEFTYENVQDYQVTEHFVIIFAEKKDIHFKIENVTKMSFETVEDKK